MTMEKRQYVVTGATSRTGNIVSKSLLETGARVRVLGRSAKRLEPLAQLGAEVCIVEPLDAEALNTAFVGVDAAYVMLQPNYIPDHPDFRGYQDRLVDNLGRALEQSGVSHAVGLSSWGAELPAGNGPVAGLHRLEERLGRIAGLNFLALRAGYFMENLFSLHLEGGALTGPFQPETKLPFVATRDVGEAAANALQALDFTGKGCLEVKGPHASDMLKTASILGEALGRPLLPYTMEPLETFRQKLTRAGCSDSIIELMLEVVESINSGRLHAQWPHSPEDARRMSLETFIREQWAPRIRLENQ
ncbi:NmrA family protein [Solidesulfovibrio carbinoliphilus subsp. oakridgensis]|uniref:NmrA family protein n=1 Tax=Solidesulfovibrio carbinoliphilus subsp. oakridgensis TaxID=694327 RepID=G7QD60_9BACT|nr:NAD(P)H-binding protein [Solidesulfovibrio carbinoliphilus]EHJ46366.1 NmrA family protein [Solidesulfovibrio carbinoliphilus subsp. oakridgensis]